MKSKRVSSEPKDCLLHILMRRSYHPDVPISPASGEKLAIFTGFGMLRLQMSLSSAPVWYSFRDEEPSKTSSSEPHDSVVALWFWSDIGREDWSDHYIYRQIVSPYLDSHQMIYLQSTLFPPVWLVDIDLL